MQAWRQVTSHLLVRDRELSPSRVLGLALGHCGHLLHTFANLGHALAAVRRRIHQFFKVSQELRAKAGSNFSKKWFHFVENTKMFAICIVEKVDVNRGM